MPKRTNDFQELIALLHLQLVPAGARVTESNLQREAPSDALREADITVEYQYAGYPITIVIECRDHKRPATVQWIDELLGKYLHRANKIIAWHGRDFRRQRLERAQPLESKR